MSASQILPVLEAFEQLGLDVGAITRVAGLDRAALAQHRERVPAKAELTMWDEAARMSGDDTLGLRVADLLKPGAAGSFEYLLRHSTTLGQLLERAQRFSPLLDDVGVITLDVQDTLAMVRLTRVGNYPMGTVATECLFAVVRSVQLEIWPGLAPLSVVFKHAGRGPTLAFSKYFGCPVQFGGACNQFVFEAAMLQVPSRRADPALAEVLEDHAKHLLSQLPSAQGFADAVREQLRKRLNTGEAQLESVASALHVSERTLRRKLTAEGTSYQEVLDGLRREVALEHVVREGQSLEQVAAELGFRDASTFYRAFKRWTGTTPAQYRAQRR